MHTAFHDVLRFYPDPTDPIVFTIGAGVDGEQRICGHTRDGVEMGADLIGHGTANVLVDMVGLACFSRTSNRMCRFIAAARLIELPDDADQWGLSLMAFDISDDFALRQHHFLLRMAHDDRAIDWTATTRLYPEEQLSGFSLTVRSGTSDTPAAVREVVRDYRDTSLQLGSNGALVAPLTSFLDNDDEMVTMALRASRPRARARVCVMVNGDGRLAF